MDLRERVVAACDRGDLTIRAIAVQFKVSVRWIYKLLRRRNQEATIAPRTWARGRKAAFTGDVLAELDARLQQQPDLTLEEIRMAFSGRVSCSLQAVANAVRRLGWRYKKSRSAPANRIDPTCKTPGRPGDHGRTRSTWADWSLSTNRPPRRT